MFRAITGYFFGKVDEAPQTSVECETREVNDWLVVNRADRPEEDIDMNDEIEEDLLSDDDYDAILDAVSCLMRSEELEDDGSSLKRRIYTEEEKSVLKTWCKFEDESEVTMEDDMQRIAEQWFGGEFCPDSYILPTRSFSLTSHDGLPFSVLEEYESDNFFDFLPTPATVEAIPNDTYKYPSGTNHLQDFKKDVIVTRQGDLIELYSALIDFAKWDAIVRPRRTLLPPCKTLSQILFQENRPLTKVRVPEVTCHPVYSKTYINHRNPAFPPKTDLIQRIKELEQEQQAQDYKIKKFISKGQLNRQNKSYLFESCSKKNRRKNLQRNLSGMNNNKKR